MLAGHGIVLEILHLVFLEINLRQRVVVLEAFAEMLGNRRAPI